MKAIKKSTLLELARRTRNYARTDDADILSEIIRVAKELATQAYGWDVEWLSFMHFVSSVVGGYSLYPKCTDEELYEMFRSLKFEVLDE